MRWTFIRWTFMRWIDRESVRIRYARIIAAGRTSLRTGHHLHWKESDRHPEEGEDLSLLDFKAIQHRRRGIAVADDDQLARICRVPNRRFIRRGINQQKRYVA